MIKKLVLLKVLLVCRLTGYAQQEAILPAPKRIAYLTADGQPTPVGPEAVYRQETEAAADGGEVVRTFYLSGAPRSVAFYEDAAHKHPRGVAEYWYESGGRSSRSTYTSPGQEKDEHFYRNGQLHFQRYFAAGKRQGELVSYYPDGKIKRRETYANNELVSGTCYDEQGQELPCTPFETMPVYPGGSAALLAYVRQNTHYPVAALRRGEEGEVRVNFTVDTTGQVVQVRIVQGVSPLLDEEALRVVRGFTRFEPGRQDERPVTVSFTVPIKFGVSPVRRPRKSRDQPR